MSTKRTTADHSRTWWRAVCEEQACGWAVERVDDAHDRARRHTLETGHVTHADGELSVTYRPEEDRA